MPVAVRPPGPEQSVLSRLVYFPGRDPLGFFSRLREHGDIAFARLGGENVYLVSDPAAIRDVLVTNQRNFLKGRGLERAKRLLGKGLLTSEGALHVRQRRLVQPAFHRDRIAAYAAVMSAYADRTRRSWADGTTIDAAEAMNRLALAIVAKTLFDADVDSQARDVGEALTSVMGSFWALMLPWPDLIEKLPIRSLRRTREARARLDRIVYGMIAERRRTPLDRGDLLSMLLLAQDEEAGGGGMTDEQVRDEAMTIFLAGHETTANALAWTWYLLGSAPDVERRLHEEVDRALEGRLPTIADLPRLPFAEQIVTEAMRLYPPAWILGRRAIDQCSVGGYTLPPRALVLMSPYIVHRDARWFPDPGRFDPDRWTPAFKASIPAFAYFPFGGGARRCIGESFAWVELVLVLTTIAQMWRLVPVPGHPVVPQPVVTLRTKHGVKVTTHRR
jgi:cytochrome P450